MGFFDLFKKKETKQKQIVIKNETTVVKKKTTVVKKKEPKLKQYPNLLVCLDPGHAASTAGKRSPYASHKVKPALTFYEYEFNRRVVNALAESLKSYGIETFISTDEARDKQTDVSLTTRATRCHNAIKASGKKAVFISVHADAAGSGKEWYSAKGWSCFTTKGQTISDKFADCFYDAAELIFKPKGYSIRTNKADGDRDWEENFTVIYKTEQFSKINGKITVPAVLTENFFYTNIKDTEYLLSEEGFNDIVDVHLKAILAYADTILKL